jgi:hypothetical protein
MTLADPTEAWDKLRACADAGVKFSLWDHVPGSRGHCPRHKSGDHSGDLQRLAGKIRPRRATHQSLVPHERQNSPLLIATNPNVIQYRWWMTCCGRRQLTPVDAVACRHCLVGYVPGRSERLLEALLRVIRGSAVSNGVTSDLKTILGWSTGHVIRARGPAP